jgi:CheY-like chemotaxis protein
MADHRKPAILVVEDEAFTRMAAADALEDRGFSPYEAGDAGEALDILALHPEIVLLFTDVDMPGRMDGIQLARLARQVRPDVGIIITSGKRRVPDVPAGGSFLPKPYRPQQLAEEVERRVSGD